jgi:hypothetical protein
MGASVLQGPCLHGVGHTVGNGKINILALCYGAAKSLVDVFGKLFPHDTVVKNQTSEIISHCLHEIPHVSVYGYDFFYFI